MFVYADDGYNTSFDKCVREPDKPVVIFAPELFLLVTKDIL
jgi:hypothetical protein